MIQKLIKQARKDVGLTQKQLAEKIGTNRAATISDIENGKKDAHWSTLSKIFKILGIYIVCEGQKYKTK